MPLDLTYFATKLRRLRGPSMFGESDAAFAQATGITEVRLRSLEAGQAMPTGDEVLILADHFMEPFTFFISNDQHTALERTEKLFRAYDSELSSVDRWAIQEFLFFCDNEAFLLAELGRNARVTFEFTPEGAYYKAHGELAAACLRKELGYGATEVPDVFYDLRLLGFHIFRRRLENKSISGLFIEHPTAGPCLLINYSEDVYRQRFTVCHEAAHAVFDRGNEYVVSFLPSSSKWSHNDLREVRADTFAGSFLVPPQVLVQIDPRTLDEDRMLELADQLKVNVEPLRRALVRDGHLTKDEAKAFSSLRIPRNAKSDPELPSSLTSAQRSRKEYLLQRGLSPSYVDLCFEANQRGVITRARLAEMLLLEEAELEELRHLFRGARS